MFGIQTIFFIWIYLPTLLWSWRRSWSSWRVFGEKGNHMWWQRRTCGGTGEQVQRLKQENNIWPLRLCLMRTVTVAVSRGAGVKINKRKCCWLTWDYAHTDTHARACFSAAVNDQFFISPSQLGWQEKDTPSLSLPFVSGRVTMAISAVSAVHLQQHWLKTPWPLLEARL